ncbi:MAG: hypothetical protein AAFQ12_09905, partial [Pseudomonadota bacterium]
YALLPVLSLVRTNLENKASVLTVVVFTLLGNGSYKRRAEWFAYHSICGSRTFIPHFLPLT